jgi:hypothetical protein
MQKPPKWASKLAGTTYIAPRYPPIFGSLTPLPSPEDEFEPKLKQFASDKGIDIEVLGWREQAVELAAREHLSSRPMQRRGRPPRVANHLAPQRDADLVKVIDRLKLLMIGTGSTRRVSDAEAVRVYVELLSKSRHRVPLTRNDALFETEVRKWQNRLSSARSAQGYPARRIMKKGG